MWASEEAQHARCCRRLWREVAARSITDVAIELCGLGGDRRERAIQLSEKYFRGRDFKLICDLAGVSFKPDAVVSYLRSDQIRDNRLKAFHALGIREEEAA